MSFSGRCGVRSPFKSFFISLDHPSRVWITVSAVSPISSHHQQRDVDNFLNHHCRCWGWWSSEYSVETVLLVEEARQILNLLSTNILIDTLPLPKIFCPCWLTENNTPSVGHLHVRFHFSGKQIDRPMDGRPKRQVLYEYGKIDGTLKLMLNRSGLMANN